MREDTYPHMLERVRRQNWQNNYLIRNFVNGIRLMFSDKITRFSLFFMTFILLLGLFGPHLSPYSYNDQHSKDGELNRLAPPSADHLLGTTSRGEDTLSRLLYGARPTVITGLTAGTLIISIGLFVGVTAGYMGGKTETALMRFTDFVYGVPLIPFAIVLAAFMGTSFWMSILIISLILWRSSARVLRSQVLQIKERPYIKAAQASGASTSRIIFRHILPNIATMAVLFFALGIGFAIIFQASLAFIGVVDPFLPSWGVMIRNAYKEGVVASAWWWSIPPGLLISLTVLSFFLLGRGYESVTQETYE